MHALDVNERGYLVLRVRGGSTRSFGRYDPRVEAGIKELLSSNGGSATTAEESSEPSSSKKQRVVVVNQEKENAKLWQAKGPTQKASVPLLDNIVVNNVRYHVD
jgi:hypothetical protein